MERRVRQLWEFLDGQRVRVRLDPAGENLIHWCGRGSGFWEVQVQGWPNLVHELAHLLQAGSLGEDSGFEYHLVPLDLEDPRGRGYLWDELGACALSCAWGRDCPVWEDAWFAEQVEILAVFFGDEDNPQRFFRRVDRCMQRHSAELRWAQARLWALAQRLGSLSSSLPEHDPQLCFPGPSTARDLLPLGLEKLKWSAQMQPVEGRHSVFSLWHRYRSDSSQR